MNPDTVKGKQNEKRRQCAWRVQAREADGKTDATEKSSLRRVRLWPLQGAGWLRMEGRGREHALPWHPGKLV